MVSKLKILTLSAALVLGILPGQLSAQHHSRIVETIIVNDSTSAIELPTYHMRIIFPRPLDNSHKPNVSDEDGITTYFLGNYKTFSLSIEITTLQGIIINSDSVKHQKARNEFTSGDEMPTETVENFNHRKSVFEQGLMYDYFENYFVSHRRIFGTKAYAFEGIGYLTEGHTYFDSLQLIFRIINNDSESSTKINNFLTDNLGLNPLQVDDLSAKIILDVFRRRLLNVLARIQLERM
jgi:hypothetical protein